MTVAKEILSAILIGHGMLKKTFSRHYPFTGVFGPGYESGTTSGHPSANLAMSHTVKERLENLPNQLNISGPLPRLYR
jgi:hypothetical protein